ncbi:MAG: hypothetical protein VW230_04740 [Candidatus Poseidoniales archaeon]
MSEINTKEPVFAPTNSQWVAEVIELRKEVDDLRQRLDELQQTPQKIKNRKQLNYGVLSDAILRYASFVCCIIFALVSVEEFEFLVVAFLPSFVCYMLFKFVKPFETFERMGQREKQVFALRADILLGSIAIAIFAIFIILIDWSNNYLARNFDNFLWFAIPTIIPAFTFFLLRPLHKLTVALTTSTHSIE